MQTTTIKRAEGDHRPAAVPVVEIAGALAVVERLPGRYSVTHLPSGQALWPPAWIVAPDTPEPALRAMAVATTSGIDWRQDADAIKAAHPEPERRELYRRMRLAAYPPRRPRWHKDARKRRLLPYEAASKREAIRDSRKIDHPALWRDFWPYRRRGVMWGILPGVLRQPCTRFGITREQRIVPVEL